MQTGLDMQDESGTDRDSGVKTGRTTGHSLTTVDAHLISLFGFAQEPEEDWGRIVGEGLDKYTYFATGTWVGKIKIGCSKDPWRRANELWRTPNGEDARVAAVLRGEAFEAFYHRHFADHSLGNEWFAPHPDILAEIERLNT